jgi:hypothetical protein
MATSDVLPPPRGHDRARSERGQIEATRNGGLDGAQLVHPGLGVEELLRLGARVPVERLGEVLSHLQADDLTDGQAEQLLVLQTRYLNHLEGSRVATRLPSRWFR